MSSFHFCLSAAMNLSSFQLLPTSLMTDLLQLFLGFPLFLLPWGFHSRAAFGISPSSFLSVWPIHQSFLFLISKFISWPVTLHKSLLEMTFGHHILKMYLRHLLTKVQYLTHPFLYVSKVYKIVYSWIPIPLKMKALCFFEVLGTYDLVAQCHVPLHSVTVYFKADIQTMQKCIRIHRFDSC